MLPGRLESLYILFPRHVGDRNSARKASTLDDLVSRGSVPTRNTECSRPLFISCMLLRIGCVYWCSALYHAPSEVVVVLGGPQHGGRGAVGATTADRSTIATLVAFREPRGVCMRSATVAGGGVKALLPACIFSTCVVCHCRLKIALRECGAGVQ